MSRMEDWIDKEPNLPIEPPTKFNWRKQLSCPWCSYVANDWFDLFKHIKEEHPHKFKRLDVLDDIPGDVPDQKVPDDHWEFVIEENEKTLNQEKTEE